MCSKSPHPFTSITGMKIIDKSTTPVTTTPTGSPSHDPVESSEGGDGSHVLGEIIACGDTISAHMGIALLRIGLVLPPPLSEDTRKSGPSPLSLSRLQCIDLTSPPTTDSEAATTGAGGGGIDIIVHRPKWWVDIDPVTGARIDTHAPAP